MPSSTETQPQLRLSLSFSFAIPPVVGDYQQKARRLLLVPRAVCEHNVLDANFHQRLCLARVWQQIDPCIVH
jgi:hypothetical protein